MCLRQCPCALDTQFSWRRAGTVLCLSHLSLTACSLSSFPSPSLPLVPFFLSVAFSLSLYHTNTNTCSHHAEFMLTLCTQDYPQELVSPPDSETVPSGNSEALFLLDTTTSQCSYPVFTSCLERPSSDVAKNYLCVFLRD